jgi:hypothetical protein
MRFLPTSIHGILDYTSALALLLMPRLLDGESATAAMIFQGAGLLTLLSSLMTRYELGLLRAFPMGVHLTIDFLMGIAFLACAFLLPNETQAVRNAFLIFGVLCLGAALFTKTRSTVEAREDRLQPHAP